MGLLNRMIAGTRRWLQRRTQAEQQQALERLHGRIGEQDHRVVDAVVEQDSAPPIGWRGPDEHRHG